MTFFLATCGSSKFATKAKEGQTEMTLKKGVCFGKCPVYKLEILKGGVVKLDAKNNMNGMLGKYQKKLTKKAYNELLQAFSESNFGQYPTSYKSNIPDLPMVVIGYMTEDTVQLVRGKEERPSSLMQLQYRLEKIAKSKGWDLVEAYDRPAVESRQEKPKYILSELILTPGPGMNLPKWFRSYEEYGVRVLKRISPNENLWLITYDMGKIKPEKLLELLKADPKVRNVEFNKETSMRDGR